MLPRIHRLEPAPPAPALRAPDARPCIEVVFTGPALTEAALRRAFALAQPAQARVVLTVPQVVPYALPLRSPAGARSALQARCEEMVRRLQPAATADVTIHVCVCRDRDAAIAAALRPGSLVVLGSRRAAWWTGDGRLARQLRRLGHRVEVVNGRQGTS